jgi:crotonobetainyl-CoA:carnitine CoA-transferase CaiB-like acyl-CoA transferase
MLPGPFCTQILADYGAEIIKIEVKGGERGRWSQLRIGDQGARFFSVNRNKKSITLDLRRKEGKAIFKKLVADSDVIVDGFRPGIMDKLELPYEELKKVNDRIIYCAINAFGSTGPFSHAPAHDINILSLAGIAGLNGVKDGKLVLPAIQLAGNAAGSLYAVIAILMALTNRQKTGLGQFCDVSMMDGAISLLAYTLAEWSGNEVMPKRGQGILTGGFAYFNIYETSDHKYVSLGASEAKFWQEFCQRIGKPEYIAIQWKLEMQEEMIAGIGAIIKEKSRAEWIEIFDDTNICFTPVLELDEMCEHPQVIARDMIIKMSDFRDSGKDMILPGLPIKFSDTPGEVKLTFPEAGEHTVEILSNAGYTSEEIQLFKINGVV